jgi:hypothetical protein
MRNLLDAFQDPFSPLFLRLVLAGCCVVAIVLVVDGGAVL